MKSLTTDEAVKIIFNEPILGEFLKDYYDQQNYNALSNFEQYEAVCTGISCGIFKQIDDDINGEDLFRMTTSEERAKRGWNIGSDGALVVWGNESNAVLDALDSLDTSMTLEEEDIYL